MPFAPVRTQPTSHSIGRPLRRSVARGRGGQPAGSPLSAAQQLTHGGQPNPAQLLQLQQTVGNGAVQRLVSRRAAPLVQRCGGDENCTCPKCSAKRAARQRQPQEDAVQRAIGDGHDLTAVPIAGDPQLEDAFDGDTGQYVRYGQKGDAVRKLQSALLQVGEKLPKYGPDGHYGGETKSAVVSFQRKQKIGDDGIVGPDTLTKLDAALGSGPGPTPLPGTPPVAGPDDFKIDHVGKSSTDKVFFERNKADLLPDAKAALDSVKGGLPDVLKLVGFASADEPPALADARAQAVKSYLHAAPSAVAVLEAKGNAAATAGRIDFSGARSVDIVPAGSAPATRDCKAKHTSGPDKGKLVNPPKAPCKEMDTDTESAFQTAWPVAKEAMTHGVNAADPGHSDFNRDLVKQFFGDDSPKTLTTLKTNLGNLQKNVNVLDTRAQCGGECDKGGCETGPIAYMSGVDSKSQMTLCVPTFKKLNENDAARNLIHETAHGTSPLGGKKGTGTKDVAYRHERMMFHLSTEDRLRNSDSYALFALYAREKNIKKDPNAVPAGIATPSEDNLVGFDAFPTAVDDKKAISLAVAQLEKRLTWSSSHVGQLYGEVINVKEGKYPWSLTWAEDLMRQAAQRFPVTSPPQKSTLDDQVVVAALRDRYDHMLRAVKRDLTITRIAAGLVTWPTDGDLGADHFSVGSLFFAATPEHQISLLLQALALATPDVEKQFVPAYVTLAEWIHENAA